MLDDFNPLAVLVVAIIYMIIGMLWYSPQVLGKTWMEAMNKREDQCKPTVKHYIGTFIVALLTTWVLALFIDWLNAITVSSGAFVGFMAWLGFIATSHFSGVIWTGKPINAYLIDIGYYLVSFLIMGGILGAWQ